MSAVTKEYFRNPENSQGKKTVMVSFMPCTAKKMEAKRPNSFTNGEQDTDYVITTTEFIDMIRMTGIDFAELEPESSDIPVSYTHLIMLLPFTKGIVKLTYLAVPGEDETAEGECELLYIGKKAVFSPTTAVIEAVRELEHMGKLAYENLNRGLDALITLNEDEISKIYEVEKQINFMNHAITNYLVKISQMTLPIDDSKSIGALFHVVNDIERIGDHAENLADSAQTRIKEQIAFSDTALEELREMGLSLIHILSS